MELWCGKLNDTVARHLSLEICSDVLNWSGELKLRQSEQAARKLATERFEELVQTKSFLQMGEEALERLLEDDFLAARNGGPRHQHISKLRG
jgi:hypothetical protein